jgi:very-short-patch-repair endonuclease
LTSWRRIDQALGEGSIVRIAHGRYSLPLAEQGRGDALRLSGIASHLTAANHWGWAVKHTPDQPHVTVRAKRSLASGAGDEVVVHWRDLDADDVVDGWVTTRERTVIDCCLDLPFDEALAVADSALRSGLKRAVVIERARWLGPRQVTKVERVLAAAHAKAANPFESALRAIALDVRGLSVEVQHRIRYDDFYARVDLADPTLKIVLEADSFEFHGKRSAMRRDCHRYDELVARGWLVLRFAWEQVMFEAEWVASVIRRTVQHRLAERGQPTGHRLRSRPA